MTIPRDILAGYEPLREWTILHVWRGSMAHGTYVPSSDPRSIDDKDTLAICVPPKPYYLGLEEYGSRGTQEIKRGEWDIVIYECRKAMRLFSQGNPNVLSALWVEPNLIISSTTAGKMLQEAREVFTGKHVYRSFVGYATAQLHKMETFTFEGYMGDKRKALVQEFGYDTKNAAHLVRLLRMGIEFLTEGVMYVYRHDAPELRDIKAGKWTLEEVKEEAKRLFVRAEEAYLRSTLPAEPDRGEVSQLTQRLVEIAWEERTCGR